MINVANDIIEGSNEVGGIKEILKCLLITILSMVISERLVKVDFSFFHSIIMFVGIIVCFGIFVFALNTYNMTNNDFFMTLGIGFFVVGVINILHTVAYFKVGTFGLESSNLASTLWIIGKYFGSITLLISSILVLKDTKRWKIKLIGIIYLFTLVAVLVSIYVLKNFPLNYVEGIGSTVFNCASRYIVICILFASSIVFCKASSKINIKLLAYMEGSIILTMVSELLFVFFNHSNCIENTMAFVLNAISYYMLYKAVVQIGLKEPFRKISMALVEVNGKLEEESDLRIRFEQEVLNSEEGYKLLIEHSSDAIVISTDNKYMFANETAAKLFGVSNAAELIGRGAFTFVKKDDVNSANESIEEIIQSKKYSCFEDVTLISEGGKKVYVKIKGVYILYNGKPSLLFVLQDLSNEKKVQKLAATVDEKGKILEETRNLNKLITEHFANVSHELRTPLNVILGAIQILGCYSSYDSMTNSLEKITNYHKTIKQNCYRLLRLVNNLIDLSKIDSGFFELNRNNGNIIEIVENITLSVTSYCESKNIELIFDTEIEEVYMAFDYDKMERIILNLLSNAIKFTREGGSILVNVSDLEDYVNITVKDSGIGICEEQQELIFERYRQADTSLSKRSQGTGIGLSLVKALIELHGGAIGVKSKLGEGTEFSIMLPIEVMEDSQEEIKEMQGQTNVERISIEFSDIYS